MVSSLSSSLPTTPDFAASSPRSSRQVRSPPCVRTSRVFRTSCSIVASDLGTFDLLADYAQPYSVAVICSMLGVPSSDTQLLLDWSHAIVKMYELSCDDETAAVANQAAAEYIDYTRGLIAEKRQEPDGLLVSELVRVEDQGDTLTEAEIVSTTMVLLEAGHEATVNTLGNGVRALLKHPESVAPPDSSRGRSKGCDRGTSPLGFSPTDVRAMGARARRGDRRANDRRRRRDRDALWSRTA